MKARLELADMAEPQDDADCVGIDPNGEGENATTITAPRATRAVTHFPPPPSMA